MGNNNYKIFLEVAVSAAKTAGSLLLENFPGKREISYKGRINIVTEMDVQSEKIIVSRINKEFPDMSILAEEGTDKINNSKYRWIIDPLDGTVNYAHNFGFWCVSIALEERNKGIIVGAVYAPYLNELYTALKGSGAELNKKPLQVSSVNELEKSFIATGFPYDIKETQNSIVYFNKFLLKAQAIRRVGSAAIDLCYVASGKFDGYWEMGLYPWDTAAGILILEEAGGNVSDFSGRKFTPYKKEILATNGLIHSEMMEVLGVVNE